MRVRWMQAVQKTASARQQRDLKPESCGKGHVICGRWQNIRARQNDKTGDTGHRGADPVLHHGMQPGRQNKPDRRVG